VLEEYPKLEPYIEDILPKKEQLDLVKLYVYTYVHTAGVYWTTTTAYTTLTHLTYRPDRVSLYTLQNTPLFFQHMDDALLPHLTLVHKYPFAFHRLRIDRGAIRFVLSGATLMAPGLTSPGGRLPGPELEAEDKERYGEEDLKEGQVVVIEAEGKETACMVGVLKMGTGEMKKVKKGQACEAGHYLGDGLWDLKLA
jgi:PUA domain protein